MSRFISIMAGGIGNRLQPLSTPTKPKQFLKLFNDTDKSLFELTYDRCQKVTDNCLVSSHKKYFDYFGDPYRYVFLGEDESLNTLGSLIKTLDFVLGRFNIEETVLAMIPADHYVGNDALFVESMNKAFEQATIKDKIITLGKKATTPATCYGYILPQNNDNENVKFVEKPDEKTAQDYIQQGAFWNMGIFVAKVSVWLEELKKYCPDEYELLFCKDKWKDTKRSISIDYAIMNYSDRISVIPVDYDWSDLGTWQSLFDLRSKGVYFSKEVEKYAQRIKIKPWGLEELWAVNYKYAGKFLYVNKGESLSLQYHNYKDETVYVLSGILNMTVAKTTTQMRKGDFQYIPHNTIHKMEAVEDCILVECSTCELQDVVRLEDKYGRV